MVPSLPLLSCELSVSVKENPDGKKNNAFLPVSSKERPGNICFNKTGEEIFIYVKKEGVFILVRKTYPKSKLIEMKLPKQLYKYF